MISGCIGSGAGQPDGQLWLPDHVVEAFSPTYIEDLRRRVEEAGGVQAEILRDGVVTPAELERAALAVRACVEERGVNVVDFSYERGVMSFTYALEGEPTGVTGREDLIVSQCEAENYELVSEVISLQTWPTEEERQRAYEAIRACLRDAGYADAFTENLEPLGIDFEATQVLIDCMQAAEHERVFGGGG